MIRTARPGRGMALVAFLGFATGCAAQKSLLFEKTIAIPEGRFVGPIAVDLPRRAAHKNRDFEIHTALRAACDPWLKISFPDGEVSTLGENDATWQALLTRRAAAPEAAPGAPALGAPPGPGRPPSRYPGHWQTVETETWPGQRAFLGQRRERCSATHEYESSYLNAFDQSGQLTFWAEVPQEIAGASISIKVYEIIEAGDDVQVEAHAPVQVSSHAGYGVSTHAGAEVTVKTAPPPPRPPPQKESPAPAKVLGAVWVPGYWAYAPGEGRWVWLGGHWDPPQSGPPADADSPGLPPTPGCTWARGQWVWEQGPGEWTWHPGHWLAPPPKVETPGPPPVPESKWVSGYWVEVNGKFDWVVGYWGKPGPRAETPPPPPYVGARWVAGMWINLKGSWVWSPGYYEKSGHPPPPPRAETPPPSPSPGSVWLAGFWRWSAAKGDYEWVDGHWERPPGEGYVWVADAPSPGLGVSLGGHWELRVKVKVDSVIKGHP